MTKIEQIWEEHQHKLKAFIKSRISNSCEADDLLQQVFLKIKTKNQTLKNPDKALSWIYQVTRNAVVDYYRTHRKTEELPDNLPELKKEENTWALISQCVRPFIEKLPPLYRDVLILSEIEGLNQNQVAKKLKIPLATAKARIQRGKVKLKKEFDDCCIFECGPRGAQIHSDTFGKTPD